MNTAILGAIIGKELRDGLRDRRAVLSAFSFPLFAPMLIAFMLNSIANSTEDPLDLAVVGAEHAPALLAYLHSQGVTPHPAPADPQAAILAGELDAVLIISADYGADLRQFRPAHVELLVDESQDASRAGIVLARQLLQAYSGQIGTLRLMARGVDPTILQALTIDDRDLADPQKRAASLLDMLVMFVVLGAFVCSMYIAIEAAAGERERKSLEPLLVTPVSRGLLVIGKWLAAVVFGLAGIVTTLLCLTLLMRAIPLESLGFRIALDAPLALQIFWVTAPLAPLAGALQLLIASFTRSFKEAQLYISLSLTLPMLPGMVLTIKPFHADPWMMGVPLLGQQLMGTRLLRGEAISLGGWAIATAGVLLLTALLLLLTIRLFLSERMLFQRG